MKRSFNILMVAPHYFPYLGGAVTHIYEVGRRIARNEMKVTILTTVAHDLGISLPEREYVEGMEIIRVPTWPIGHDCCFAPKIFSLIKPGSWDIIHCQGCHTFVPLLTMIAARRANIPYIVTFHTGVVTGMIRRIQWEILRPHLTRAAMLIGVSHFEANYFGTLLHIPANKMKIIPNGADLPKISPIPNVSQINQIGYSSAPPSILDLSRVNHRDPIYRVRAIHCARLIISMGRLVQYKGHHRLIIALPKIREEIPDAQLLILGTGPYESALRALAQKIGVAEHVTIQSIPGDDRLQMAETLAQASLVALLSDHESHPLAVLEALSLQRPVLVTDTSGLREFAHQGLARAISLHSTPEEIAEAAIQQIRNPLLPPASFVLPTWDKCAEQLQTVYMEIIDHHKE